MLGTASGTAAAVAAAAALASGSAPGTNAFGSDDETMLHPDLRSLPTRGVAATKVSE